MVYHLSVELYSAQGIWGYTSGMDDDYDKVSLPIPGTNNYGQDCYCILKIGDQKQRSKVVSSGSEPYWGETFEFTVNDPGRELLEVELWDRDYNTPDDFLGKCQFSLSQLHRGTPAERSTELILEGKSAGRMNVILTPRDFGSTLTGVFEYPHYQTPEYSFQLSYNDRGERVYNTVPLLTKEQMRYSHSRLQQQEQAEKEDSSLCRLM